MTTTRLRRRADSILRVLVGAVIGAAVGLAVGLVWIRLAPDNGFADLAAASITRLVLLPLGAIVGALVARRRVMLSDDR